MSPVFVQKNDLQIYQIINLESKCKVPLSTKMSFQTIAKRYFRKVIFTSLLFFAFFALRYYEAYQEIVNFGDYTLLAMVSLTLLT